MNDCTYEFKDVLAEFKNTIVGWVKSALSGSGKGFDADKLDGKHASEFVSVSGTQNITGLKDFKSGLKTDMIQNSYGNGIDVFVGESKSYVASIYKNSEYFHIAGEGGVLVQTPDVNHSNFQSGYSLRKANLRGQYLSLDNGRMRIFAGSRAFALKTPYGNVDIGPQNSGWSHFVTDRPNFYFNKGVYTNGKFVLYGNGSYLDKGVLRLVGSNPSILLNNTSDSGVDVAIKADREDFVIYEPEQSNKEWFRIRDDRYATVFGKRVVVIEHDTSWHDFTYQNTGSSHGGIIKFNIPNIDYVAINVFLKYKPNGRIFTVASASSNQNLEDSGRDLGVIVTKDGGTLWVGIGEDGIRLGDAALQDTLTNTEGVDTFGENTLQIDESQFQVRAVLLK